MASETVEYLQSNSKSQVVGALEKVIANTYTLYFKTHAYHWNVEGPQFKALHEMFEEQYTDMWTALDELAERLRALGAYAPMTSEALAKGSTIKSADIQSDGIKMADELAKDNTTMAKVLMEAISITEEAGDEVTTDMFIGRAALHEKYAWMLRSMSS